MKNLDIFTYEKTIHSFLGIRISHLKMITRKDLNSKFRVQDNAYCFSLKIMKKYMAILYRYIEKFPRNYDEIIVNFAKRRARKRIN